VHEATGRFENAAEWRVSLRDHLRERAADRRQEIEGTDPLLRDGDAPESSTR
jgi:hypothetical protein